ncbi:MAG: hypothetical protein DYG89_51380 [Caldilinea sp. CFX5]|nr:hypothetical protein [Caldilinea sp. CFX5]
MNKLLEQYTIDVDYPEVSGIEHLLMLETRSKLYAHSSQLSADERRLLAAADRKLAVQATKFLHELKRFVNLAEERRQRDVTPEEWWWYLDVLVQAPALPQKSPERTPLAA